MRKIIIIIIFAVLILIVGSGIGVYIKKLSEGEKKEKGTVKKQLEVIPEAEKIKEGIVRDQPKISGSGQNRQASLLIKYAPILFFHDDEGFLPKAVDSMVNESQLMTKTTETSDEKVSYFDLKDSRPGFSRLVKLELKLIESLVAVIPNNMRFDKYGPVIYGRVNENTEEIFLQYWIFYPYNDGFNKHEGDWELIQVNLNSTKESNPVPNSASYFYHDSCTPVPWKWVEKVSTHPIAYITKGGHGSYPVEAREKRLSIFTLSGFEKASSSGTVYYHEGTDVSNIFNKRVNYTLIQINKTTKLANFSRKWGEPFRKEHLFTPDDLSGLAKVYRKVVKPFTISQYLSGPDSPGLKPRFKDPSAFSVPEGCKDPPYIMGITGSPVNLHAYDDKNNHVGLITKAGIPIISRLRPQNYLDIEVQIPNTYTYSPSDDGYEIIDILASEPIRFEIKATDEGEFDFLASKFVNDTYIEYLALYQDNKITKNTNATVTITKAPSYSDMNMFLFVSQDDEELVQHYKQQDYGIKEETDNVVIFSKPPDVFLIIDKQNKLEPRMLGVIDTKQIISISNSSDEIYRRIIDVMVPGAVIVPPPGGDIAIKYGSKKWDDGTIDGTWLNTSGDSIGTDPVITSSIHNVDGTIMNVGKGSTPGGCGYLCIDKNGDDDFKDTGDYNIYSGLYVVDASAGIVQPLYNFSTDRDGTYSTNSGTGSTQYYETGVTFKVKGKRYTFIEETSAQEIKLAPTLMVSLISVAQNYAANAVALDGTRELVYESKSAGNKILYFIDGTEIQQQLNINTSNSGDGKKLADDDITASSFKGYKIWVKTDDSDNSAKVWAVRKDDEFSITDEQKNVLSYYQVRVNDSTGFPAGGNGLYFLDNATSLKLGDIIDLPGTKYTIEWETDKTMKLRRNITSMLTGAGGSHQ